MTVHDKAPLLEVQNLSVEIATKAGSFFPVNDHSFTVHAGETLGIVGESGSGKSMTAMSLMRLLPKHAARIRGGSVRLAGRDLMTLSERDMRRIRGKEISMILQDPMASLNPVMTVGAQLTEALRRIAPPDLHAAAVAALEEVRIPSPETRLAAWPHQMSGGMRQRAVAAIALAQAPRLLICDEPTTALDATVQVQVLDLLRALQAAHGMAMLFVTHDFGVVARICDRVAVMYAGRIVECAPVEEIFARPAHPYTRALLASVPSTGAPPDRLPAIPGQPPGIAARPAGCAFHPRCPHASAQCRTAPPERFLRDGHSLRCWHPEAA